MVELINRHAEQVPLVVAGDGNERRVDAHETTRPRIDLRHTEAGGVEHEPEQLRFRQRVRAHRIRSLLV